MTKPSETKPSEPGFHPFADGSAVETLGGLSIENGLDAVALHGSLDLTRDRRGLERARRLQTIVAAVVATLEAGDLPDAVAEAAPSTTRVKNPFA